MDKQLKEIEKLEGYSGISGYAVYFKNKQQFEWLKQQVEEVSYLKRERNACEKLYDKEHEWAAYLARENQRYKEALEDIARWDEMLYSTSEVGIKARQALKGESE